MENIALVVGATGITGSNLAQELISNGWTTYGLARNPNTNISGLISVKADLLDVENLEAALEQISPTHIFFTTWMRNDTEEENIKVNSALVRNLLNVLSPKKSIQHVALVTGLKHYLGPFEAYAKSGALPETPLREEQPRLEYPNFYYAQEDAVYEAAERDGFSWSIHRPHTVIGYAVGNLMNMGTTLAIYASICKETGRKFIFPGSFAQWNGLSDVTDARILAKQLLWASTTEAAKDQAFNITNGDVFRWKWLWEKIANHFQIDFEGFENEMRPLEKELQNDEELWKNIAEKYNLKENKLSRIASAWHTDLDLGRPIEVMTDMAKSRKLGFTNFQSTLDSFTDLFEKLKEEKIIP
ncbi:SDR family oxidoreductase [Epilithonimonas lactis]|uniref:NAD-dependent dehydratase n=1 Tax=Epilithonimonas lactis TaxID=421072 RepID=A0A085BKX8_9FLAO|nr:SDR family oxidoreductase [Epilithonimonas lactis]KFC18544.1 NAD-dependent dehydratase [Epilithonimonas lactis]KFC23123.1 NAD-dependent dehydratase [Epilithonimonas lactis]SEQ69470.1 Nucleoside-diphosphate-sugar epimerase [Epilithonimonas lactis]